MTLEFWQVFLDLGGRTLIILLLADIFLLLIMGIYGNAKNQKDRKEVPTSNKEQHNSPFKQRASLDGMAVLETNRKPFPTRLDIKEASSIDTAPRVWVATRNELARTDRVITDIKRAGKPVQLSKDELPQPTERKELAASTSGSL